MRVVVLTALLLLTGSGVSAGPLSTGDELLSDCEIFIRSMKLEGGDQVYADVGQESMRCWGFMGAAQQFMNFYVQGATQSLLGTCVPSDVSLTQLIRVIVSYGEQHPEDLHQTASVFVLNAVRKAFMCGSK